MWSQVFFGNIARQLSTEDSLLSILFLFVLRCLSLMKSVFNLLKQASIKRPLLTFLGKSIQQCIYTSVHRASSCYMCSYLSSVAIGYVLQSCTKDLNAWY